MRLYICIEIHDSRLIKNKRGVVITEDTVLKKEVVTADGPLNHLHNIALSMGASVGGIARNMLDELLARNVNTPR